MRRYRSVFLFILVTVLLSWCQHQAVPASLQLSSVRRANDPAIGTVVITGQANDAPAGCHPNDIVNRLLALTQAINTADLSAIPALFGTNDGVPFLWYSLDAVALFHLADLTIFLEDRIAHHEQITLHTIQFNGWEVGRDIVHFGPVEFRRTAADLPPGSHRMSGKGAYHCVYQHFVVLSFGTTITTQQR